MMSNIKCIWPCSICKHSFVRAIIFCMILEYQHSKSSSRGCKYELNIIFLFSLAGMRYLVMFLKSLSSANLHTAANIHLLKCYVIYFCLFVKVILTALFCNMMISQMYLALEYLTFSMVGSEYNALWLDEVWLNKITFSTNIVLHKRNKYGRIKNTV